MNNTVIGWYCNCDINNWKLNNIQICHKCGLEQHNAYNRDINYNLNDYGERIEEMDDFNLNLEYWDCECDQNYIHSIRLEKCQTCHTTQENGPSSRDNEVDVELGRPPNLNNPYYGELTI